jgi:hypothetical protein
MNAARVGRRLLQVTVGLVLGLVVAEGMFWWRDDGAFPHVNFYVADPSLATRLQPHAKERLAFGGNPATTIATNALGFRTHATTPDGEWPATADTDVLVVGDSQVFGLGVEVGDTFSSKLAERSKRTVLNGGVPTYGPQEYAAVVDEVLKTRKVKRVVFVINLANDLFELSHPNTERHAVWDGWAVRKETAPAEVSTWPGRQWLFSQSHLVFAARAAWAGRDTERVESESLDVAPKPTLSTPSEGHWTDLLTTSAAVQARPKAVADNEPPAVKARNDALEAIEKVEGQFRELEVAGRGYYEVQNEVLTEAAALAQRHGRPDDIIISEYGEGGREIYDTASALLAGAMVKKKMWAEFEAKAKKKNDPKLLALVEAHAAALRAYDVAVSGTAHETSLSPLAMVLQGVKRRCDQVGAKLIVVALPLDVMVSSDEWKKYAREPLDMAATKVLVEEVVRDADAVGAIGVDVTEALRAAEPGAFLDRDLHMTAKGHDAVAAALVPVLDVLPALKPPRAGLPPDRSYVPSEKEWGNVTEIGVAGSSAAGCETKQVREWLKVACMKKAGRTPTGVAVVRGGEGDAHALYAEHSAVLLAPVLRGKHIDVRFFWAEQTQDLSIDWPASSTTPTIAFAAPTKATKEKHATLNDSNRNALCWRTPEFRCSVDGDCAESTSARYCDTMYGALDDGCVTTCASYKPTPDYAFYELAHNCLERCLQAQPEMLPTCANNAAHAFGTQRCHTICDADRPCSGGEVCLPWQDSGACVPASAVSP